MGSSLSFSTQNYSMFYCLIKKHKFLLLSWFCLHNFLVLDNFNGFYTSQIKLNFCWRDKLKFVYLFFFFKVLLDRSPSTANHVPAHVRKSEGIESFFSFVPLKWSKGSLTLLVIHLYVLPLGELQSACWN